MNSRDKGARGERELANILKEYGFEDARRGQQYCGANGDADVVGLDGFHIECKRKERLNIDDAMVQSECDADDWEIPIVVHRKNYTEWKTTMYLDDFLRIAHTLYSTNTINLDRTEKKITFKTDLNDILDLLENTEDKEYLLSWLEAWLFTNDYEQVVKELEKQKS